MDQTLLALALLGAVLAVPACADSIAPDEGPDGPDGGPPPPTAPDGGPAADAAPAATGRVATVRRPDGTYTTRIDASASDAWIAVDLETGGEAAADGPWDLACQRFHVKLNGGVSGDRGVEVAPLVGADFAAVTAAPADGWIRDAADGDDPGTDPDLAFEQGDGWYVYDPATHVLTPRPVVWVIRTSDGNVVKAVIESYYDDAGTSGHPRLRWAPLGAP